MPAQWAEKKKEEEEGEEDDAGEEGFSRGCDPWWRGGRGWLGGSPVDGGGGVLEAREETEAEDVGWGAFEAGEEDFGESERDDPISFVRVSEGRAGEGIGAVWC